MNHKLYQIHLQWVQSIWKIKRKSNWNANGNGIVWPRLNVVNANWNAYQNWKIKSKCWKVKMLNWAASSKHWKGTYLNWNNKWSITLIMVAVYRRAMFNILSRPQMQMTVILNRELELIFTQFTALTNERDF